MKKNLFILFILVFFSNCTEWIPCRDEKFSFPRTENNSKKLKINGYYYGNIIETNSDFEQIRVLFLNGVFLIGGDSIKNVQSGNIHLNPNELVYKSKNFWGVYKINEDSIEIQRWIPMTNGCVEVEAFKGVILNDTTFALTKWYKIDRKGFNVNINTIYSIWKFHQYSPKPDSVVSFIP